MLFLFLVLSIQQKQIKNGTTGACNFTAGAHEFVLLYLTESGEIVYSDTTLLPSAFLKTAAWDVYSFSVEENSAHRAKCVTMCCSNILKVRCPTSSCTSYGGVLEGLWRGFPIFM